MERFVEKTVAYLDGRPLEPLEVDLCIGDFRLKGKIHGMYYPEKMLHYRYAKTRAKDHLKTWIHHLALNSILSEDRPRTSILAGLAPQGQKPGWIAFEYLSVQDSENILGSLLEKYWEGLIKPLHFFSETSWHYAQALLLQGKTREESLRRARNTWNGNEYNRGENSNPYYDLFFRNMDPLDPQFQDMAEKVFGPLLEHQTKVTDG